MTVFSLEAQLAFCRQELNQPTGEKDRKPIYKHNQQLEELRNLQDKLTQEKEQWQRERENEQKDIDEKRKQLTKLQVKTISCPHFRTDIFDFPHMMPRNVGLFIGTVADLKFCRRKDAEFSRILIIFSNFLPPVPPASKKFK